MMKNIFYSTPYDADAQGHFGELGGRYVPENLMPALLELERAYATAKNDPTFLSELMDLYQNYSGRPTPLTYARNLSAHLGGAQIYIKNEGLNHTGAHKMNHCLGQALLARRMGKKRLIAETGAGQHGLAVATVAAKFGFACTVYMGEVDYERQRPNVFWMEQLGATVVPVTHGTKRLKDAVTAAIQDWIANVDESYYLLGSALGPHPYPSLVRDFQNIVGLEVREQLREQAGRELPDYVVACVGGGSNAIGIFNTFLEEPSVRLIGVEAGGKGVYKSGEHAARLAAVNTPSPHLPGVGRCFEHRDQPVSRDASNAGCSLLPARPLSRERDIIKDSHLKKGENKREGVDIAATIGVVEGYKSYFLQNEDGQIQNTHSISAGLDYAGIGPEHGLLYQKGRVQYVSATDKEVLEAFQLLARTEGLISALESAHAFAHVVKLAPTLTKEKIIVVNMSGRGDKDLFILGEVFGGEGWREYLRHKSK